MSSTGGSAQPSITGWTRLEPYARDPTLALGLQEQVRDPLWFLARQWQFGEFMGNDSGSPIMTNFTVNSATGLMYGGTIALDNNATPIETLAEGEPLKLGVKGSAQLGWYFENLLQGNSAASVVADFRNAYPILPFAPVSNPFGGTSIGSVVGGTGTPASGTTYTANEPVYVAIANGSGVSITTTVEGTTTNNGASISNLLLNVGDSITVVYNTAPTVTVTSVMGELYDLEAVQFRQAVAGLVTDGWALYCDLVGAKTSLPASASNYANLLNTFVQYVGSVYYQGTSGAQPAWVELDLKYALSIGATSPSQNGFSLTAEEFPGGTLDWFSFSGASTAPGAGSMSSQTQQFNVVPQNINFRGMPGFRWWYFDDAQIDMGGLDTEKLDLVKMLVAEAALVYGNDWFHVPVPLPVNSINQINGLTVQDSFGVQTTIGPQGAGLSVSGFVPVSGGGGTLSVTRPWSFFSIEGLAPNVLFLPQTLDDPTDAVPLEDVLFLRDDTAAMGWAIESTLPGPLDNPVNTHDAYFAQPGTNGTPQTSSTLAGATGGSGVLRNPFGDTSIGANGTSATPTSGTTYVANELVAVTIGAGTGQTITTKDTGGTTIDNAVATLSNRLLNPGYSITVTYTSVGAVVVQVPNISYLLGTEVPDFWIPLVRVQAGDSSFYFRRGVMGYAEQGQVPPGAGTARGVILDPSNPFFVHDYQITPAGTEVTRYFRRARSVDGSTYTWVGRKNRVGKGPGWSGLLFDVIQGQSQTAT